MGMRKNERWRSIVGYEGAVREYDMRILELLNRDKLELSEARKQALKEISIKEEKNG